MLRFRALAVLVSSCLFSTILAAQAPGTGLYAFGSFDNRGFDSINLGNLNQHFEIPIVNKQGRGLNFSYVLAYDGLIWNNVSSSGIAQWTPEINWGFSGQLNGALTGYMTVSETTRPCTLGNKWVNNYTNFVFHDSFGGTHLFNYSYGSTTCGVPPTIQGDGSTSDGSGLSYQLGQVYTRNGSTINAPTPVGVCVGNGGTPCTVSSIGGSIVDSNGNTITANSNGTFTDTLGVTSLTIAGAGSPGNPRTFTYPVVLQSDGSQTASASMSYTTYTVQTNFGCSGVGEYGPQSVNLPSQITLADGSYYQFTYESTPGVSGAVTGRLASITLPTGGTISYSYSGGCNGDAINSDGTIGAMSRTTTDGTRTYSRAPSTNGSTTTVQDENGNQSLYTFTDVSGTFYETHRQLYQGSIGGTPLLDQQTCYNNGSNAPCDGAAITLPITQAFVAVSQNGGQQRSTLNTYNGSSGLLTNSAVSDYGGAALENTSYTYTALGRVSAINTTDGSGHTISKATYGYDEQTPTTTSNIPQHNSAIGSQGNQTSSHLWINTSNTTLDTTTAYYNTGVPISSTGPTGTTQYSYEATQGFATQVTPPTPSSGVSLPSYASYDVNSGVQLSSSDANNGPNTPQVQYAQYDKLLRPTQISTVDGGGTTYSYNLPPNAYGGGLYVRAFTSLGGGNPNANTDVLYDTYGRVSRVGIFNGLTTASNDWYQVDYCYDAVGNLHSVSAQYQSSGMNASKQCSGTGTTYTYDALGRVTNIDTPDGNTTYQYNSRAVERTDVNGVQKIVQKDALGRIMSVCEISSNSLQGDSPQACGQDIAGTGYLANYTYSLSTYTTTITQGAQTRTFTTDSIGRSVSVTEPESGTTTYSYAYNSTGLVVTRIRPQANQTNPSITTTTTTQYDAVGRIVSVNYNDGITTGKSYLYDQATNWGTVPLGSSKGHLTYADGGGKATQFAYDSMGRITNSIQCLPGLCGQSQHDVWRWYSYDLGGNLTQDAYMTQGDAGTQVQTNYTVNSAGQLTSISDTRTGSIISNMQDGPYGPTTWSLGNGLTALETYDWAGRPFQKRVCATTPGIDCSPQIYGNNAYRSGNRVTETDDTISGASTTYGYDEFNRLTSASVSYWNGSPQQTFGYVYDRYGNRWQQNAPQGGPAPQYTFNKSNNQVSVFAYDAAGNVTNDGSHSYTYDADGKVLQVDGGSTASYTYDALNNRVQTIVGGVTTVYAYNLAGQRVASFDGSGNPLSNQVYAGNTPVSFYQGGQIHYQHQDWLGTERVRTGATASVEGSYISLPFGDGYSVSGSDNDAYHFAQLDHDTESSTEHAQFRNYSSTQGRWLSPDPYSGSYHFGNPQSFNRYNYAMNRPLSGVDPSGLEDETPYPVDGGGDDGGGDGGGEGGGGGTPCPVDACVTTTPDPPVNPDPPTEPNPDPGCDPNYCVTVTAGPNQPVATVGGGTHGGIAPNKVGCNTVLPNGKTLGQYINQGRAQMQASANAGGSFNGGTLATFASIARDYGQIDFKNGAAGTSVLANRAVLGQAGNFAYYAIGSGYLSPGLLDAGAGAYAVTSALLGKKPFSTLVGPMFSDASAASIRNAALATPGCPE